MKKNRYIALRLKILWLILRRRLVSFRKMWNIFRCYAAFLLRSEKSAKYPFTISIDLSNDCNANCIFCRTAKGEIYNCDPDGPKYIEKGRMPFELYTGIIDEIKDDVLLAILYVNGEPLIYSDIYRAISYATERRLATMIATNGQLLTERNSLKLIESGICFVKVAVSGFSNETYGRQNRVGDVEKVKANLARFQELNRLHKAGIILLLDFMVYDYNRGEIPDALDFCAELGIMFNLRPGNPRDLEGEAQGDAEPKALPAPPPASVGTCDWPWKILTVNWNGDVFPCCDYVVWAGAPAFKRIAPGDIDIAGAWNGKRARANRKVHARKGRGALSICRGCTRSGIAFKY